MKWRIAGADRATGEDRTIEVEAFDERQANLRAKAMNMLVEKIELTAPIPAYQSPPIPVATKQPDSDEIFISRELESSAGTLGVLRHIFIALGVLAAVGIPLCIFAAQVIRERSFANPADQVMIEQLLVGAGSCLVWCIICFTAAACLRMLISLGFAASLNCLKVGAK